MVTDTTWDLKEVKIGLYQTINGLSVSIGTRHYDFEYGWPLNCASLDNGVGTACIGQIHVP